MQIIVSQKQYSINLNWRTYEHHQDHRSRHSRRARATGRKARTLHVTLGDAHIYENHVEAMEGLRHSLPAQVNNPQIEFLTENTDIDGYRIEDFSITGYVPGPFVKLPVAV